MTDPLQRTTLLEYTDEGRISQIIDPLGQRRSFTWNSVGQPTSVTDELGYTSRFEYDTPFSLLSRFTDAAGNATQYLYDSRGNLLSTIYANGSADFQSSNSLGQIVSYTNRRGQVINFTYNSAGQLTEQQATDGTFSVFTYDERGNVLSATNANTALSYVYDSITDRLMSVTYSDGRSLSFTYDAFLRRATMTDETGWGLEYRYDSEGRLRSVADSSGATVVLYSYDKRGRLASERNLNGTVSEFQYSLAGELEIITHFRSSGAIASRFVYAYDKLSRPISQSTSDGSWTYDYDAVGQLTRAQFVSANENIPSRDLQYIYDSIGNWTTSFQDGQSLSYTSNNLGQYISIGAIPLQYDADGNLISASLGGVPAQYSYNSLGLLISISEPVNTTLVNRDPFGRLLSRTTSTSTVRYMADPVSGLTTRIATPQQQHNVISGLGVSAVYSSGEYQFLHSDISGSIVLTSSTSEINSSPRVFDPFGKIIQDLAANELNVPTRELSFNGRYGVQGIASNAFNMGARTYSATIGRFVSKDPIGIAGGLGTPYGFAANSPVAKADPTGLIPIIVIGYPLFLGTVFIYQNSIGEWLTGSPSTSSDAPTPNVPQDTSPFQSSSVVGVSNLRSPVSNLVTNRGNPVGLAETFSRSIRTPRNILFSFASNVFDPLLIRLIDAVQASNQLQLAGSSSLVTTASAPNAINVGGIDPNDIIGPSGFGTQNFIRPGQDLPYRIRFENFGPGSVDTEGNPIPVFTTGPAQRVEVVQRIDDRLDLSTFRFTSFGFGDVRLIPDQPTQSFSRTVPFTFNERTFNVILEAFVDTFSRELVVTLNAADPRTQLPPELVTGFLPPEDGTGRGQGFITYTVRPVAGVTTGTQIRSVANIVFDGNPPIPTNQIDPLDPGQGTSPDREALITIDADRPTSRVLALAPTSSTRKWLNVRWSGDDVGAGIQSFDIFVSKNNGPFTLWRSRISLTSDWYRVSPGNTYSFYSVARDQVGNTEIAPAIPDASTLITLQDGLLEVTPSETLQPVRVEDELPVRRQPRDPARRPDAPQPIHAPPAGAGNAPMRSLSLGKLPATLDIPYLLADTNPRDEIFSRAFHRHGLLREIFWTESDESSSHGGRISQSDLVKVSNAVLVDH